MSESQAETGHELVLDNRKLIVAFAVLIAFFGCFFVVGFKEGKRQGYQEGLQASAETAQATSAQALPAVTPDASDAAPAESAAAPANSATDPQLNWYKSVNRGDADPGILPPASEDAVALKKAPPADPEPAAAPPKPTVKKIAREVASKVIPQARAASAEKVTYSVQVGAFRARREAEAKAKAVQAKGFDCRIGVPQNSSDLYLVKVGKFSARADAAAMQLRLKNRGFNEAFIKIN